jgi:hypothetical protein
VGEAVEVEAYDIVEPLPGISGVVGLRLDAYHLYVSAFLERGA